MWGSVKVKTKPATLPISVADLKARLRIDSAAEDAIISDFIKAAVAEIDGPDGVGVAMMSQTWTLACDGFAVIMRLPGAPVSAVSEVRYRDAAGDWVIVDPTLYRLINSRDPAVLTLAPNKAWPAVTAGLGVVEVDYVLGAALEADVDPGLVTAAALLAGHYYENRGAVIVGTGAVELPLGVRHILDKHRRGVVAG